METRFADFAKALRGRWQSDWPNAPAFADLRLSLDSVLGATIALSDRATELRSSGKFSEHGLTEEIREFARSNTVPVLVKAKSSVELARQKAHADRQGLVLSNPTSDNVVEAMQRAELRAWLKSLPIGEAMGQLMSDRADQRLIQAVFEMPPPMSGLTDQASEHLKDHLLAKVHGTRLDAIASLGEAIDLANAAIETSLYQLRRETNFSDSNLSFNSWFEQAAPTGSEVETAPSESAISFEKLDDNLRSQIDEIFARHLPTLYPSHPVNQRNAPNEPPRSRASS